MATRLFTQRPTRAGQCPFRLQEIGFVLVASLAFRRNAFDGLSTRDRKIVRLISELLALGQPARYLAPGAVEWFVFDDHRFKAKHIAYLGRLVVKRAEISARYTVPMAGGQVNRSQLAQDTRAFCDARGVVLPKDVAFAEDGNPWQEILDAQGAPGFVRMGSSVPDNWIPVVEES